MKGNPVVRLSPERKEVVIDIAIGREIRAREFVTVDLLVSTLQEKTGVPEAVLRGHVDRLIQLRVIEIVRPGDPE